MRADQYLSCLLLSPTKLGIQSDFLKLMTFPKYQRKNLLVYVSFNRSDIECVALDKFTVLIQVLLKQRFSLTLIRLQGWNMNQTEVGAANQDRKFTAETKTKTSKKNVIFSFVTVTDLHAQRLTVNGLLFFNNPAEQYKSIMLGIMPHNSWPLDIAPLATSKLRLFLYSHFSSKSHQR